MIKENNGNYLFFFIMPFNSNNEQSLKTNIERIKKISVNTLAIAMFQMSCAICHGIIQID